MLPSFSLHANANNEQQETNRQDNEAEVENVENDGNKN